MNMKNNANLTHRIFSIFGTLLILTSVILLGCGRGGMHGGMRRRGGGMMDRSNKPRTPEALYQKYCADCHGIQGDGNGQYANEFKTRPANFTKGVFKFKKTRTGQLPTDLDIYESITYGARTTGMLPQLQLSYEERKALVEYIKSFAPVEWEKYQPQERLKLPPRPQLARSTLVEIGRTWFKKAGCFQCHGEQGRGDGPAVPNLKDEKGRPIRVPDLTTIPYKRGEHTEAIAWVIYTGRDGTPMPSFAQALQPKELWGIAEYVKTLQTRHLPRGMMGLVGEELKAMRIDMEAAMALMMAGRRKR